MSNTPPAGKPSRRTRRSHLVQSLAETAWRLNGVAALETNLLTLGVNRETSFVAPLEKVQDALAIAASLESQTKALSNLSMHTQRLSRQFERIERHLRELQDLRRRAEVISKPNKILENPAALPQMASFFKLRNRPLPPPPRPCQTSPRSRPLSLPMSPKPDFRR